MSNSVPPRYVEKMKVPLVAGLEMPINSNVLNLGTNQSPFGAPQIAIDVAIKKASELHQYCDPLSTDLRHALGTFHRIDPDQIVCGNGSEELLDVIGRLYARPGDEILHSEYGYRQFEMVTHRLGATQVKAPADGMTTSVDGLLSKVTNKTKVCFIANPENPTGTYIDRHELSRLTTELPPSITLVIDSAYAEYIDDPDYSDGMTLVDEHQNVVVVRTFSKAWGLAGLRVGWAYCPTNMIGSMNTVRGLGNVNSIAQAAATAALKDTEFLKDIRLRNREGIQRLTKDAETIGLTVVPSAGNFILMGFPNTPGKTADAANNFLLSEGIILRHVPDHGLPNHIRMTLGTPEECRRVMSCLKRFLN